MQCIEHDQKGVGIGYGTTSINGLTVRWHRLVYCQHNDVTLDSIKGKVVRHTCDNPRCINPLHLVLGNHQDNMDDRTIRGRNAKGAVLSGKLSDEDVKYIRKHYKPRCKEFGGKAMQARFNIAPRTLYYILDGRNWKHLEV